MTLKILRIAEIKYRNFFYGLFRNYENPVFTIKIKKNSDFYKNLYYLLLWDFFVAAKCSVSFRLTNVASDVGIPRGQRDDDKTKRRMSRNLFHVYFKILSNGS